MKFDIVEKIAIPSTGYSVVLAKLYGGYSKWVTWIELEGRYNLGHYFIDQDEAWIDFIERVIKELRLLLHK